MNEDIPFEIILEEHGIEAELLEFRDETRSARQAAQALGTDIAHIIKSLVFFVEDEPVLAVIPGDARVSEEKLAVVFETDASNVRIADPDEVSDVTGFPVGAVPPVGVSLAKVVDPSVLDGDTVYGGGGARDRMLKIDPRFIVDENDQVAKICE